MIHARDDYNRIQDPLCKIPTDEPVFLLRAQDINAPETLEFWANLAEKNNASPELVELVRNHAKAMLDWQRTKKCKVPDM